MIVTDRQTDRQTEPLLAT